MKRFISIILTLSLFSILLSSCAKKDVTAPTCDEVIKAYEEAGYMVFHVETTTEEWEHNCYLKVYESEETEYEEYVFFYFFDSEEEAQARDEEREYNILIYLFSIIYGRPSWLYTKTYGNIEYEYDDHSSHLMKPFKELIK